MRVLPYKLLRNALGLSTVALCNLEVVSGETLVGDFGHCPQQRLIAILSGFVSCLPDDPRFVDILYRAQNQSSKMHKE